MSQLANQVKKIQKEESQLSQEVLDILNILDKIEDHTAELRKKIVGEVSKEQKSNIHLSLNKIDNE
jgi:hypothetical protein